MKPKLIAAIIALQLVVLMVFAQTRSRQRPPFTHTTVYQITGRVIQVNADTIVLRARKPDRGNFVVYYFNDTRFTSPVSVGDTVTIDYKMAAVTITPVGTPRSR